MENHTPIPKKLTDIVKYLSKQNIVFSSNDEDGRVNSLINEHEVLRIIRQKFDVSLPRSRNWFDFILEENGKSFPVNIKITKTESADNLNCKLGIYYALTGLLPDFSNSIGYGKYFENLKNNIGTNKDRDYFFLVINKKASSDVFVNSLRGLQTIQPNGNNLPFQCKWEDNRIFQNRNFEEAKDFILSVFGKSAKLRAEAYVAFEKLFPEYV